MELLAFYTYFNTHIMLGNDMLNIEDFLATLNIKFVHISLEILLLILILCLCACDLGKEAGRRKCILM